MLQQPHLGVLLHSNNAGFHLGISSWGEGGGGGGGEAHRSYVAIRPRRGEGRLHNYNYWQYLGGGGKLGQFGGEVELFGGGGKPSLRPPP